MTPQRTVPKATVFRLSLYLRQLGVMREEGAESVSSRELGQALKLTPAQVRKDLTYFGQFGTRGVGYRITELMDRIRHILGTDRQWNAVVLGTGNLGRALSAYKGFARQSFNIVAVFDNDPAKVGTKAGEFTVQPMEELPATVARRDARIALLCVPAPAAQSLSDVAVRAGIRGILNFAPVRLVVPEGTTQVSEDLAVRLEQLSFQMQNLPGGEQQPLRP